MEIIIEYKTQDETDKADKADKKREWWRNASKKYYEKNRDIVKSKKLANYYKKLAPSFP